MTSRIALVLTAALLGVLGRDVVAALAVLWSISAFIVVYRMPRKAFR